MESSRKSAIWASIAAPVLRVLREHCARASEITIHFDRLRVERLAVIVRATAYPPFIHELRRDLGAVVAKAGLPILVYNLVHITLARYARTEELDGDLVESLESMPVSLAFTPMSMRIVRELIYPSLRADVLTEVPLPGSHGDDTSPRDEPAFE
jgi:hypothetical protein